MKALDLKDFKSSNKNFLSKEMDQYLQHLEQFMNKKYTNHKEILSKPDEQIE